MESRLSVFAGGFSIEATESVCAGGGIEGDEVLGLLCHVVDKSLVTVREEDGEVRYRLLETVRQYGREKLVESGEDARALAEKPRSIRSLHGLDRPSEQPGSMVFYGYGKRISYFRLHEASRLLSRALLRQAKNVLPGLFH